MTKTFYLTTPLYYVNGIPHVGHLYTTVIADAIARYARMGRPQVCALTGTDEHGLKIERASHEQRMTARQLTDTYASAFKKTWEKLSLDFDEFIRTTEKRHHKAVKELFLKIQKNGFVYLGQYSGYYCVNCEAYVSEKRETCPDCGRATEFMTEESYFFKLSAFRDKLLGFYHDNPDFIIPSTRMNEVVSFVRGGLKDLSISRTSFTWGIPVPGNEKHIFYVWFDALAGYLSGVGYGTRPQVFDNHWPADVQLIGKDILRFHAVYWPAFLMAAELEPPRKLLVNGWWTVNGEKMSKSRGNFTSVQELINLFEPDHLRYFLLREIPLGADGDFSYKTLLTRVNSDLANDLGNLVSRTLKMVQSYFGGIVPECGESEVRDEELKQFSVETIGLYRKAFDALQLNKALENVWELISLANKYIVANEPWVLAREPEQRQRLGTILYTLAEVLRIIAVLLQPVVPAGAKSILRQLGLAEPAHVESIISLKWGALKEGSSIGEIRPVYPRLDKKKFLLHAKSFRQKAGDVDTVKDHLETSQERITINDFHKVDMRVGRIISAKRLARSEKLLRLKVDIGTEIRQVVAGIGKEYSMEDLLGRLVVVVANLKPAKIMGVESNGMIVAASDSGSVVLTTFVEPVTLGAVLK